MKSLISLAGGGSLVNLWRRIPAIVKVPVIFGAGVLAAAELNIDANHAWFSNRIFGGQAAQGEAQMVDPADTRKAVAEGKHVSGAERMIEVQVSAGDADARTKTVYADAALESETELLGKKKRGERMTSTEELRLKELQLKEQELRRATAEADTKVAQATAAQSGADMTNYVNGVILGGGGGGDLARRMMADTESRIWGKPAQQRQSAGGDLVDRAETAMVPPAFRGPNWRPPQPRRQDTRQNSAR